MMQKANLALRVIIRSFKKKWKAFQVGRFLAQFILFLPVHPVPWIGFRSDRGNVRTASGSDRPLAGLDRPNVSRRHDASRKKAETDTKLAYAKELVAMKYCAGIAESQP